MAVSGKAFAEETLTVSNTALSPTTATFRPTGQSARIKVAAIMEVLTNGVWYTLQSATATPDVNDHQGTVGTVTEVEDVARLRLIRSSGSDAAVKLTYFQK